MKKKAFIFPTTIILVFIMLFFVLTGCSGNLTQTTPSSQQSDDTSNNQESADTTGNKLSAPGELPLSNETISFTLGIPQSAVVEDWKTNKFTQKLEQDLNIDLKFVELPPGKEFQQKLELMIMAGGNDLPEIIIGSFDLATLVNYGQMGMILPTNEYYKNIAYYTKQTCGICSMPMEEMLKFVTCHDGNIYGLFGISESLNNMYSGCRILLYKPWLDALNLAMPQTTDELTQVLQAIKTNDLNKNGSLDEIPLMAYADTVMSNLLRPLMNPFIYCQENYYVVNDKNTIEFAATQNGWKEGLKYIKKLFDEELISPLSLTQDAAQLTSLLTQDETIVGGVARISVSNMPTSDPRRNEYYIMEPLEGPSGLKQAVKSPSLPTIRMIITKNCKNPEAAFRFGDYMCEENVSLFNRFGEKGVDWVVLDQPGVSEYAALGYKGDIKQINDPWGSLQNLYWGNTGPQIMNGTFIFRVVAAQNGNVYTGTPRIAESLVKSIELANPKYVTGLIYNEQEQEVINEFRQTINDYVAETFAQFVTGTLSIEDDWNRYVEEFNKMGLKEYLEAVNAAYSRQQNK